MRSNNAAPSRKARVHRAAAWLARQAICLSLLAPGLFVAPAHAQVRKKELPAPVRVRPRPTTSPAPTKTQPAAIRVQPPAVPRPQTPPDGAQGVTSLKMTLARQVKVNLGQLSKQAALDARRAAPSPPVWQEVPPPLSIRESDGSTTHGVKDDGLDALGSSDAAGPLAPSPAPSQNYLAQEDSPKAGTGTVVIPPDTMGAVGLDKVFVNLNNNYRVQNKATGAPLSTVSIDAFWASTGATGVFDPRVQFDPYQGRWLLAAVSNASSANSSLLVGVSDTADPQGTYTLFRFVVGCAGGAAGCHPDGEWADFPMLGFNKNWVAVGWNQFTSSPITFVAGKMAVLDYPALRAGTATGTLFNNPDPASAFCMHPATTLSPTEETLYVPVHQSSAAAIYRLHRITGTPAAPVFNVDATERVRPGGGWTQPFGDVLPQRCVPGVGAPTHGCPAVPRGIEAQDAFIRSNVVFRNGRIYYPQSVALPAGLGSTDPNLRYAAQWTALNPDGSFAEGGRVDEPSATKINGGRHYAYPSLAVNKHGDLLLGFSEFESDDYADAAYALRLATDPAGTLRDPVVYKEGEDYYQKTFSGSRNRWGDYSHTVVDPANDREMWTIQEYAALRTGLTGLDTNDSRWGTWWAKVPVPAGPGDLLISEFRLRGPAGANDEFIEIYNNSGSEHRVQTADGSAGYAVVAQDNGVRCTIPNGTVIPARGHFLCVNSAGYSLAPYPAGNGTTATGDATYTADIPDNSGLALFRTASPSEFSLAQRLDAVGFTTTPAGLYLEGAGLAPLSTLPVRNINHSFYRDNCGKSGSITTLGPCPTSGLPKDTDNNAVDFIFVDTNGTNAGAGQRLGAPGPENLSSPVLSDPSRLSFVLLDATAGASNPPNRVRDLTGDPANNSTFGTLELRRRVFNNSGAPVTRLRFRIADITTFPTPPGFADMRARSSSPIVVSGVADPATCSPAPAPCAVTVQGTTLEEPPAQPVGGGFNSTMSVGTVTFATPLAPGASVNVRFLLGLQQTGTFKFIINLEVLP